MGRRGPAPKPTKLKILNGNPGKRPLNDAEPQPKAGVPTLPDWVSEDGRHEWKRIVSVLRPTGVLTLADRAVLAGYCQAYAESASWTRLIDKEGWMVTADVFDRNGEVTGQIRKPHPGIKHQRDAFNRMKQYLIELGLSPASRSRVKVPPQKEEVDPLQELINRHGKKKA